MPLVTYQKFHGIARIGFALLLIIALDSGAVAHDRIHSSSWSTNSSFDAAWTLSDRGTSELMAGYYRLLLEREGSTEALRDNQIQMHHSKRLEHPEYWASFIHSGEWANMEGRR